MVPDDGTILIKVAIQTKSQYLTGAISQVLTSVLRSLNKQVFWRLLFGNASAVWLVFQLQSGTLKKCAIITRTVISLLQIKYYPQSEKIFWYVN